MKNLKLFFILNILIASLAQVMADLYLPSLPAIKNAFHTTNEYVQWTIAIYVLGYSIAQLFYGPISDALGRKKPLLTGILIATFGSFFCVKATNIGILMLGRFLQGLGAGAGLSLSRTITRDLFSGAILAKLTSYFSVGNITVIACSPLLGAYIQLYLGWHFNFVFLLCYSILLFLLILILLPETHFSSDISCLTYKKIIDSVNLLFLNRIFVAYAGTIFFTFGAVFAWITISSVLLIEILKISPAHYGLIIMGVGFIYALMSFINAHSVSYITVPKMIDIGIRLMLAGGIGLLLTAFFHSALCVVIFIYVFVAGTALVFANAIAGALNPFPQCAGLASAILSFLQILGGALSSSISSLSSSTAIALAFMILVCSSGALFAKRIAYNKAVE